MQTYKQTHTQTHTERETEKERERKTSSKTSTSAANAAVNVAVSVAVAVDADVNAIVKRFFSAAAFTAQHQQTRDAGERVVRSGRLLLCGQNLSRSAHKKNRTHDLCVWRGASSSARRFHNVPITAPAASPPLAMPTAAGSGWDTWGHCCPFQLEIVLTNEMGKIPNWYFKQAHSVAQHQAGQRVHKTKCDSNWRSSRDGERDSHSERERERERDSKKDEQLLAVEIRSDANRTR